MEEASIATGIKLTVAHYRREQPIFKKVKELIEKGTIGEVRFANLQLFQPDNADMITKTEDNWRINPELSGGGLFHDLAPHQLDLMIYFFGKVIKANGTALNQAGLYQADDIVTGNLLFENKVVFNGLWCYTVPKAEAKDVCEIIGSEGKLSFAVFEHQKLLLTQNNQTEEIKFDKLQHVQQPMIEKVVQYFLGETQNPCSAGAGVEVMTLMDTFTK
jgi:predicted dehydrogenase